MERHSDPSLCRGPSVELYKLADGTRCSEMTCAAPVSPATARVRKDGPRVNRDKLSDAKVEVSIRESHRLVIKRVTPKTAEETMERIRASTPVWGRRSPC